MGNFSTDSTDSTLGFWYHSSQVLLWGIHPGCHNNHNNHLGDGSYRFLQVLTIHGNIGLVYGGFTRLYWYFTFSMIRNWWNKQWTMFIQFWSQPFKILGWWRKNMCTRSTNSISIAGINLFVQHINSIYTRIIRRTMMISFYHVYTSCTIMVHICGMSYYQSIWQNLCKLQALSEQSIVIILWASSVTVRYNE